MWHYFWFLFILDKYIFGLTETTCAKRSLILKRMVVFFDPIQFLVNRVVIRILEIGDISLRIFTLSHLIEWIDGAAGRIYSLG